MSIVQCPQISQCYIPINKIRDKYHIIISIVAEKPFEKKSTSTYDKNSQQSGYGKNISQHDIGSIQEAHS